MGITLFVSRTITFLSTPSNREIQEKLLTLLSGTDREILVEQIKPQLLSLKKYSFAKQIAAVRSRILFNAWTVSDVTD